MNSNGELNELARENLGRLILVVTAGLMLQIGFRLWSVLPPGEFVPVVVIAYAYGTALALLVAAIVDLDLDRWGYYVAGWSAFVILVAGVLIVWLQSGAYYGTDAILFSRYSVDLLLAGRNPFAESMAPAAAIYGQDGLHITPLLDGTTVDSLSYPGGAVLAFVPQAVVGLDDNFGPTLLLATFAILAYLIVESPSFLALLPIAIMTGSRNLVLSAPGGVLDSLWVLPLLVAMRYWHTERYGAAGLAYGLAAGTKQQVWPIAPFLVVWLWAASDDVDEARAQIRELISWSVAGFLALNFPFIVWHPKAWLYSVLTPALLPMMHQGVGLTLSSTAGVYGLPSTFHTLLLAGAGVVGIGLYALYWDRGPWVAWIAPPILLLWSHRSLNSYFTYFLPIAYYAVLCQWDLRRPTWPRPTFATLREWVAESMAAEARRQTDAAPDEVSR